MKLKKKKKLKLTLGGVVALLCRITCVFLSCLSSVKLLHLKEVSGDVMQEGRKSDGLCRAGIWKGLMWRETGYTLKK